MSTLTKGESRRYGSDFGKLIGQLKRAAIDAYMVSQGFVQDGNRYEKWKSGNPQTQQEVNVWVEMPDSLGAGGGQPDDRTIPGHREDYSVEFGEVRSRINDMVWRWQDLPDPDGIEVVGTAYTDIEKHLRMNDLEAPVSAYVQTIEDKIASGGFKGIALEAFQSMLANYLRLVIEHHWALSGLMASLMYSQVGIWTAARSGFVQVVEAATAGFNKIAQVPTLDVGVVLRVLQYALSIADVDSLRGAIDKAVDVGLKVLDGEVGSSRMDGSPGSFEEGMNMMQARLDALALQIWTAENDVRSVACSNMGTIGAGPEFYELSGWSLDSAGLVGKTAEDVGLDDRTEIEGIDSALGRIYVEVDYLVNGPAGAAAQDQSIALTVRRDQRLGLGQYGPADSVRELNEMLVDLMGKLAEDLDEGKRLLWAAYDHLNGAEADSAARLDTIARAIDEGGANDPWDYTVPSFGDRVIPNLYEAMGIPPLFLNNGTDCAAPPDPRVDYLAERYSQEPDEGNK